MKPSRIIMSSLAWLDLLLFVVMLIPMLILSLQNWRMRYPDLPGDIRGGSILFMLSPWVVFPIFVILGFIAKPRYFWIGLMIAGILHILAFSGGYKIIFVGIHPIDGFLGYLLFFSPPGFILLGLGFLLRNITKRKA